MKRLLLAFAALLLLVSTPVETVTATQEIVWTCAYPGFGAARETVIVKFRQSEDKLRGKYTDYVILQDNDLGLVAVTSWSEKATGSVSSYIGASVIIIDKTTLRFRRSNAIMTDNNSGVAQGKCVRELG